MKRDNGKRQKRPSIRKIFLILACGILSIMLVIVVAFNLMKEPPSVLKDSPSDSSSEEDVSASAKETTEEITSLSRKDGSYNFLLAASDQSSGNSDVIMVVNFDTVEKKVGMVSIPRDTLINPEDGYSTYPKINSTYLKGVDNLSGAVSNLLGIPIDYYVTVDVKGFVKLIDTIGGIDFNIPVHMSYDDPVQNLYIHFEPGMTHLSGKDVLKVCRLRDNNDGTLAYPDYDIGRTRVQQQVLVAVAKKMLLNPPKINTYLEIFQQYVKTDLSLGNMLWFVEPFLSLDLDSDIASATLPGDGSVSYHKTRYCYELSPDEVVNIVNQLVSPYVLPRTIEDMNIFVLDE